MQSLDEVSLNFQNQQVKLTKGNKTWHLKGIQSNTMEVAPSELMDRSVCQMTKGWVLYACSQVETTFCENQDSLHPDMKALLQEFAIIFEEPQELPPKRRHDHQVPLINGAESVNLRPYRHPWEQKNIIEKMIAEMLEAGIIRDSKSPYASPIVLSRNLMELGGFVWIIEP